MNIGSRSYGIGCGDCYGIGAQLQRNRMAIGEGEKCKGHADCPKGDHCLGGICCSSTDPLGCIDAVRARTSRRTTRRGLGITAKSAPAASKRYCTYIGGRYCCMETSGLWGCATGHQCVWGMSGGKRIRNCYITWETPGARKPSRRPGRVRSR